MLSTPLSTRSSVLAVIPHYQCEPWLSRAVDSLLQQSRPPDAVAVIDDGSTQPPERIIQQMPGVTLLASKKNVGPYALVQRVIDQTDYDAILFQDADDWSAPDRLIRLLKGAERTGAEVMGSYHVQVDQQGNELMRISHPTDVNAALLRHPAGHFQLHPTTLVARALVHRLGGFATALRFSGDTEFIRRARWVGKIINLPQYLYYRMERANSLTNSPSVGFSSRPRIDMINFLQGRAVLNAIGAGRGKRPDLRPCAVAPPVELAHICGPALKSKGPESKPV